MSSQSATDFEKGLLGVVLLENGRMALVVSLVQLHHFGLDSHQQIFGAMLNLYRLQRSIDTHTLADQLRGISGCSAAYIADLTNGMYAFSEETIRTYAGKVRESWKARQVIALAESITATAQESGEDIESVIETAQSRLEAIACDSGEKDATADSCADTVLEEWEREHKMSDSPAVGFGIASLDQAVGGMFPGHQVVVGARSSAGKTRFLTQATAAVCAQGQRVQLNLIEPTREEIMRGLACFAGGMRASVASEPWTATREERDKFHSAMTLVRKWPLEIYDNANMTLDQVVARGRAAIHRGCRMIGLDYLQRLEVPMRDKGEQMRLRIARASMTLANLVKKTECTSLVLSQLKRTETMGIPTMQDLRESGQIENDAHLIVLLHRDYDSDRGIFKDTGAYVVPKRRFGSPTNKRASFNRLTATWEDGETKAMWDKSTNSHRTPPLERPEQTRKNR
jgi:replicative DNA helicase